MTIEAGVQVAAATTGEGDILSGTLPGGHAATTTHLGPYDRLSETHAAIQEWIDDQDLVPAGPPWECYVTDPTHVPDPADWKTEVFWPLAS
jgi:AraC family transcriptional regulator